MKKEVKLLANSSINSLICSIEWFNRPSERGRAEAVLIFIDRSFELLMKAIIIYRGGKIREKGKGNTIGSASCINKCLTNHGLKCLTKEQALTIQTINSLRDAAQHYLLDLSEDQLYIHCQAGLTLYRELLNKELKLNLRDYVPDRVLPISTRPPHTLIELMDSDYTFIRDIIRSNSRRKFEAKSRLHSLAIIEQSTAGIADLPTDSMIKDMVKKIEKGLPWKKVFPGIAALQFDVSGSGLTYNIKLTKNDGVPIRIVDENEEEAVGALAVRHVHDTDHYSLGLNAIAKKVNLSPNKTLALIRFLKIQDDPESYKLIKIGKSEHKRYSQKALLHINDRLPKLDIEVIWDKYGAKARPRRAAS